MEYITPEPMHRKTKTVRIVALVVAVVALVVVAVLYFLPTDKSSQLLSDKETRRQAKLEAMQNGTLDSIKDKGETTTTTEDPAATQTGGTTAGDATAGTTTTASVAGSVSQSELYTVTTKKDVTYGTVGGSTLKIDIYTPNGVTAPTPLVLYIHGGGFRGGSKNGVADDALMLAKHGVATVGIDYRLSGTAIFPASLHDIKGVARYMKAHATEYNIDPNAFFTLGESAGGVLASLMGVTESNTTLEGTVGGNTSYDSNIAGVINISGSYIASIVDTMSGGIKNAISAEVGCSPVPSTACKSAYEALSPETYISSGDSPFIILHGDKDGSVPTVQATTFNSKLTAVGVKSEVYVASDLAHVGGLLSRYLTQVINFINTNS
jgi:acetyl esterase/lipase